MATSSVGEAGGVSDATTISSEERQRLIQTGQITPFGSSVEPCTTPQVATLAVEPTITTRSSTNSSREPETSRNSTGEGLFPESTAAGSRRASRKAHTRKRVPANLVENDEVGGTDTDAASHSSTLEPDEDFEESGWIPSLEDLLEDDDSNSPSGESDYYTDDELGGKKKKKLRPLSSDGLSDEEDDVRPSKGKGKRKRRTKRKLKSRDHLSYNDDGDVDCYHQRIQ